MFILREHVSKGLRHRGGRIVPATISPLRVKELKNGEYIGFFTGYKIRLINHGGFIDYVPEVKHIAYLANEIPATLDEDGCNANVGELYVPVDSSISVQRAAFEKTITVNWDNSDFWIPSAFYLEDELIGKGWFNKSETINQAIIVNSVAELKPPIRIEALKNPSIVCEAWM